MKHRFSVPTSSFAYTRELTANTDTGEGCTDSYLVMSDGHIGLGSELGAEIFWELRICPARPHPLPTAGQTAFLWEETSGHTRGLTNPWQSWLILEGEKEKADFSLRVTLTELRLPQGREGWMSAGDAQVELLPWLLALRAGLARRPSPLGIWTGKLQWEGLLLNRGQHSLPSSGTELLITVIVVWTTVIIISVRMSLCHLGSSFLDIISFCFIH